MVSTDERRSNLGARRDHRRASSRRSDQQERAILDAAERQLDGHRYEELTVATVAEAAGISRSGVYFYFASMEDLLVALVRRGLSELMASIESVPIPPDATPCDVLAVGLRRTSDAWRSRGQLLRSAVDYAYRVPAVYEQWHALLQRGVDLYLALMIWSADLEQRPRPDVVLARRHAELCMLMVGHALHDAYETSSDPAALEQLEEDLLILVGKALELSR